MPMTDNSDDGGEARNGSCAGNVEKSLGAALPTGPWFLGAMAEAAGF